MLFFYTLKLVMQIISKRSFEKYILFLLSRLLEEDVRYHMHLCWYDYVFVVGCELVICTVLYICK